MILWMWPQNTGNESKSRQMGLPQTKTPTHSKGNQQSKKTVYGMGENICKPYIW